ncbi:MAG: hypothetical protein GTO51_05195 [Candidatus Latescibacteria bacterium]|nr:hypothetical protein [Candidatus Latescibacterota bacterium]NIO28398.1 hypothetical protein [Candidatus Latescibacterota bacterium]NIO55947.1 hypothetical protein [Candidatus Latescibacterota bacterium]NIT01911.1 hypothetical protein [Candidatus Latescibacterota bacterium]
MESKDFHTGLPKVKNTFTNWLYLEDDRFIDVALATIIAHRFGWGPIWLFVIAPSGSGKTEVKAFGSGVGVRSCECRFGLIRWITPAIEKYQMMYQVLGERFCNVRIYIENREKIVEQAMKNAGQQTETQSELA